MPTSDDLKSGDFSSWANPPPPSPPPINPLLCQNVPNHCTPPQNCPSGCTPTPRKNWNLPTITQNRPVSVGFCLKSTTSLEKDARKCTWEQQLQ